MPTYRSNAGDGIPTLARRRLPIATMPTLSQRRNASWGGLIRGAEMYLLYAENTEGCVKDQLSFKTTLKGGLIRGVNSTALPVATNVPPLSHL